MSAPHANDRGQAPTTSYEFNTLCCLLSVGLLSVGLALSGLFGPTVRRNKKNRLQKKKHASKTFPIDLSVVVAAPHTHSVVEARTASLHYVRGLFSKRFYCNPFNVSGKRELTTGLPPHCQPPEMAHVLLGTARHFRSRATAALLRNAAPSTTTAAAAAATQQAPPARLQQLHPPAVSFATAATASAGQPTSAISTRNDDPRVSSTQVLPNNRQVEVLWDDGHNSYFDYTWLRVNCPSFLHECGQRTVLPGDVDPGLKPVEVGKIIFWFVLSSGWHRTHRGADLCMYSSSTESWARFSGP